MTARSAATFLFALMFSSVVTFGQNSNQQLNDQFWEAVRKGDATAVVALLDKGADVNAKFRYGTTALFKAAERGHLEVVKILLARGADVAVKDTFYGATAMTWAMQNNHIDIVNELLEKLPGSVSEILLTGVTQQKPDLITLALTKSGLEKTALTTALFMASMNEVKPEIVEMLKKAGAVPAPQIESAKLQSYAGKYKSETGTEVTTTVARSTTLVTVIGAGRGQLLIPVDETTFTGIFIDNLTLRFKVEEGKVTGLTLTQGKTTTELSRVIETKP
jgi:ankyrin repeat protein